MKVFCDFTQIDNKKGLERLMTETSERLVPLKKQDRYVILPTK
jgi:hypothetical protein